MSTGNPGAEQEPTATSGLCVLEFRGTEHEIGHRHGTQLREEIGLFYGDLLRQMCRDRGTTEDDLLSYARAHLPAAKEYAPELVDEIRGISEGAEFQFDQVFLINCFDEVCWHGPSLLTKGLHACTAFAASGRATVDGKCYVGESWDAPDFHPPYLFRLLPNGGLLLSSSAFRE